MEADLRINSKSRTVRMSMAALVIVLATGMVIIGVGIQMAIRILALPVYLLKSAVNWFLATLWYIIETTKVNWKQ